jgi:DNA helicase IV
VTSEHPELPVEQQYVDRAYHLLDIGLADAERSMSEYRAQHRSTAQAIQRALRVLQESSGTGQLVFGKMVDEGDTFYIGRRRVRDENNEPVVISWHTPMAQRYYEASPAQPNGVDLKRVFTEEERRLVRVVDEIVAASAAAATDASGLGKAFSDALLHELDRSRDGAMRDVVATIQAEQFAIIRAAADRVVVVQGGPGTGKTVVGLHRAAWLAFNDPDLRRTGVLVVAPSTTFLTYVSGVLPSLDVTDVDQVEIQRLYAGEAEVTGTDSRLAAQVKGSASMAPVLHQALAQRVGWSGDELTLNLGGDHIVLTGDAVRAMLDDVRSRDLSHNDKRELVRTRLASMAHEQHRVAQNDAGRPVRANEATIRRLSAFTNAVDRMWPSFTPEELLRSLYGTQAWLVSATEGILTADERAAVYRPMAASVGDEPWTEADLFCLDEAAALLHRDVVTYGHLVVDEAQDLSPMQARALARRCPAGSFTLLGDLAQTTGAWLRDDWEDLTQHLAPTPTEVHALSIGYRVPAPVLELAAGQLPVAGISTPPPRSIRLGMGEPRVVAAEADDLETTAGRILGDWAEHGLTTAVLVAERDYDDWWARLGEAGLDCGDGRDGDFSHKLTLVPHTRCKGLEFDAVLLVEPADLAEESLHAARSLYVAMTRCTQALAVVHSAALPAGFPVEEQEAEATEASTAEPASTWPAPPPPPVVRPGTADLHRLVDLVPEHDLELVRAFLTRLTTP